MLPAELAAYLRVAMFGQTLAQIHRHLPRHSHLPRVVLRLEIINPQTVVRADGTLDVFDGDTAGAVVFHDIANRVLGEHLRDGHTAQRRDGDEADERSL